MVFVYGGIEYKAPGLHFRGWWNGLPRKAYVHRRKTDFKETWFVAFHMRIHGSAKGAFNK